MYKIHEINEISIFTFTWRITLFVSFGFLFFFVLLVLGFELMTSGWLGKHSTM
jgi:hypothetical protein